MNEVDPSVGIFLSLPELVVYIAEMADRIGDRRLPRTNGKDLSLAQILARVPFKSLVSCGYFPTNSLTRRPHAHG